MRNDIFRKGLVIGIIILFVGISNFSCIDNSKIDRNKSIITPIKSTTFDEIMTLKDNEKIILIKHPTASNLLQSWAWAKRAGGTGEDVGFGVAVDGDGNTYVIGYYQGSATFGNITLTSQGAEDVFVAKLNTNGVWQWANSAGGIYVDEGYDVAVDSNGNVYITGTFTAPATFGNTILTTPIDNVFVAKLNTNGVWQWANSAGGIYYDRGFGIAVDGNGNAYITGCFENWMTFGNITITGYQGFNGYVAKLNTNGAWQWARGLVSTYYNSGKDVAVDSNGNVYITGFFDGLGIFGNITITSRNQDVYIAKLNTTGVWQWAKGAGSISNDHGYGVVADGNGNVYITGVFCDLATFGNITISYQGAEDVFIAKLNTNGVWQWAKGAGGGGTDFGYDVAIDGNGNAYITGCFENLASFGNITLTSQGAEDVFIAKLNTNGVWQWAKSAGGDTTEYGHGVAVDGTGKPYIVGYFYGTISFDNIILITQGDKDVFIAKLWGIPLANFTWNPQNPDPGQIITFNASVSYDPDGYIVLYEWDWNNDGIYEENHTTPTATHSWSQAGSYPVKLRVTDNDGATDTETKTVNVVVNQPPVADFTWTPLNPNPGETITFDASASDDPDGTIVAYAWDMDDDGQYDDATGVNPTWQFQNAGAYDVGLKVTDDDGATDIESKTVNVGGGNQPFYFLHLTDIHIGSEDYENVWGKILKQINELNPLPAFVVVTGDIADTESHQLYYNIIDPFWHNTHEPKLTGSKITSDGGGWYLTPNNIPFFFCPGNHDSYNFMYKPTNFGEYEEMLSDLYYHKSLNINDQKIEIFSLTSGMDLSWPDQSPQGDGLKNDYGNEVTNFQADAAASTAHIKIVLTHHPFNSGDNIDWVFTGGRDEFYSVCNQYHIDLLCCGHEHSGWINDLLTGNPIGDSSSEYIFPPGGDTHIQLIGDNIWSSPSTDQSNPGQYRKIEVLSNGDIKIYPQQSFTSLSSDSLMNNRPLNNHQYNVRSQVFLRFLIRFPNAFPLLRQLMGY